MFNPKFWNYMDYLLDGPHRYKVMTLWIAYLGMNMAILGEYCYRVTPQWH